MDKGQGEFVGRKLLQYANEKLELMVKMREKRGKWVDSEEEEVGLLKTLEALSAVLSFGTQLDELRVVDSKFEPYVLKRDVLVEDIENVLEEVRKYGYAPIPYFTIGKRGKSPFKKYERGKTDFVDSASFLLTTLIDVKNYFNKVYKESLSRDLDTHIDRELKSVFNWLVGTVVEDDKRAYWLWGDRETLEKAQEKEGLDIKRYTIPYVYFTWSAVVALAYYGISDYATKEDREDIGRLFRKVVKWFEEILVYEEKSGYYIVNYEGIDTVDRDFDHTDLIFIVNALEWIHTYNSRNGGVFQLDEDSSKIFVRVMLSIYKILKKGLFFKLGGGDHTIFIPYDLMSEEVRRIKNWVEYEDRASEILLITALVWGYNVISSDLVSNVEEKMELKEKVEKEGLDNWMQDKIIELYLDRIRRNVHEETGLWPKQGYLIYYTQRVFESLLSIIKYISTIKDASYIDLYYEDFKKELLGIIQEKMDLLMIDAEKEIRDKIAEISKILAQRLLKSLEEEDKLFDVFIRGVTDIEPKD